MWVTTEPGELLMSRVLFWLNAEAPDPEDRWLRAYLDEWGVEPKRTWTEEHEGVRYEILQFGECYIRAHVRAIKALMRQGLAAGAVRETVDSDPRCNALFARLDADAREQAIWAVAGRAEELDAVEEAEDGGLAVSPEFVLREFKQPVSLP